MRCIACLEEAYITEDYGGAYDVQILHVNDFFICPMNGYPEYVLANTYLMASMLFDYDHVNLTANITQLYTRNHVQYTLVLK